MDGRRIGLRLSKGRQQNLTFRYAAQNELFTFQTRHGQRACRTQERR